MSQRGGGYHAVRDSGQLSGRAPLPPGYFDQRTQDMGPSNDSPYRDREARQRVNSGGADANGARYSRGEEHGRDDFYGGSKAGGNGTYPPSRSKDSNSNRGGIDRNSGGSRASTSKAYIPGPSSAARFDRDRERGDDRRNSGVTTHTQNSMREEDRNERRSSGQRDFRSKADKFSKQREPPAPPRTKYEKGPYGRRDGDDMPRGDYGTGKQRQGGYGRGEAEGDSSFYDAGPGSSKRPRLDADVTTTDASIAMRSISPSRRRNAYSRPNERNEFTSRDHDTNPNYRSVGPSTTSARPNTRFSSSPPPSARSYRQARSRSRSPPGSGGGRRFARQRSTSPASSQHSFRQSRNGPGRTQGAYKNRGETKPEPRGYWPPRGRSRSRTRSVSPDAAYRGQPKEKSYNAAPAPGYRGGNGKRFRSVTRSPSPPRFSAYGGRNASPVPPASAPGYYPGHSPRTDYGARPRSPLLEQLYDPQVQHQVDQTAKQAQDAWDAYQPDIKPQAEYQPQQETQRGYVPNFIPPDLKIEPNAQQPYQYPQARVASPSVGPYTDYTAPSQSPYPAPTPRLADEPYSPHTVGQQQGSPVNYTTHDSTMPMYDPYAQQNQYHEPRQLGSGIRAPPPGPKATGGGKFKPIAGFTPVPDTSADRPMQPYASESPTLPTGQYSAQYNRAAEQPGYNAGYVPSPIVSQSPYPLSATPSQQSPPLPPPGFPMPPPGHLPVHQPSPAQPSPASLPFFPLPPQSTQSIRFPPPGFPLPPANLQSPSVSTTPSATGLVGQGISVQLRPAASSTSPVAVKRTNATVLEETTSQPAFESPKGLPPRPNFTGVKSTANHTQHASLPNTPTSQSLTQTSTSTSSNALPSFLPPKPNAGINALPPKPGFIKVGASSSSSNGNLTTPSTPTGPASLPAIPLAMSLAPTHLKAQAQESEKLMGSEPATGEKESPAALLDDSKDSPQTMTESADQTPSQNMSTAEQSGPPSPAPIPPSASPAKTVTTKVASTASSSTNISSAPKDLYERLAQVGEGTYGKVYKARNTQTGALVGLKRIRMEAEKDGFPVTSIREIKLLQSLSHPNVVGLMEMMVSKGQVYMVFEYSDHDLTGILHHPAVLFSPSNLKSLMAQLLRGLSYIHDRGVLHRDLKGSNILLSKHGELKIADFGLAKFYSKGKKNDLTNRVITQWYKPPELLFGATVYGPEVDMWSAGCIFLELFTKRPVFQGQDEIHQLDVIYKIMGTPTAITWPGVDSLPWYELVKPKAEISCTFHAKFASILHSSGAEAVAEALLAYSPDRRPSAAEALRMPYFTTEEPKEERPEWLKEIKGDWHEMESKEASRKKRKQQQQAQAQQK